MSNAHNINDKILGCLYVQAIGDALGLGTEFMNKDEVYKTYTNGVCKYEHIIQDTHRRRWPIGAWTDTCAILGAKYGYSSIPRYYIENLNNRLMYNQNLKYASF